ncbi:hypothetical protein HY493_01185 [Candidatus Woesearchaeota archaeon]|nr:hypothetical protein [Candidatus Woesearchaeota archaeon]
MHKKGQAAMEFLMTYGWAILVVLAAIAALAYFGVLSPDRFLPEKCTLPSGLACLDSTLTTSGATIVVQNSLGFGMSNVTLSLSDTAATCVASSAVTATINNGEQATFTIACTPTLNAKYKGTLSASYINSDTGLAHTLSGELIKKVSP